MSLDRKVDEILARVRQCFPHWTGFADPRFQKGEVEYKRRSIGKAGELLNEAELRRLIAAGDFDEVIRRLERLGKDSNLLWFKMLQSGDLRVLYRPGLDRPSFCEAILDLLYGPGPSPERLGRYADYLESHNLPNYWTFPTYFLFLCHPQTDIFVKPNPTNWFLEFVGQAKLPARPTPGEYSRVLEIAGEVREALREYGPQDMVDIQSVFWLCYPRNGYPRLSSEEPSANERVETPPGKSSIVSLLHSRPQVILQGAPGTGKTHNALLATAEMLDLLGEDATSTREALRPYQLAALLDEDQSLADDPQRLTGKVRQAGHGLWDIVQLHPSYTYEDFVRGLRVEPHGGRVTFRAVNRILGLLAESAALLRADGLPVVLILDEINRGDLSKVLGELVYALEYRGESVLTPYEVQGRLDISLPSNLYLIGTMNTADRSIALVDYAIRRRFYFVTLRADRQVLARYYEAQPELRRPALALFDAVAKLFENLRAGYDPRDLAVGHTYFMADSAEYLVFKFVYDVVPLLREYQREGLLEHLVLNIDGLELDLTRGSQPQLLAQVRTWFEEVAR